MPRIYISMPLQGVFYVQSYYKKNDNEMPNKDPNTWTYVIGFLKGIFAENDALKGVIMAGITVLFKNLYYENKKGLKTQISECMLCGCLTLTATNILEYFSVPSSFSIGVGGAIGFIGVNKIAQYLDKMINKKTRDINRNDDF